MTPTCGHCRRLIPRRAGDSLARWQSRRYCSRDHAMAAQKAAITEHRAYTAAEAAFLIGTDSPANIARRLGYASTDNLARVLEKWGLRDLARHYERQAA